MDASIRAFDSLLTTKGITDGAVRTGLLELYATMLFRERLSELNDAYGNVQNTHPLLAALFASYCEKKAKHALYGIVGGGAAASAAASGATASAAAGGAAASAAASSRRR
jgi:hypothetical protein